ncbi:MAG: FAD-dependent oxidoreductase [Balneolaceae bacterium]|nr:FAD-dependent oxidoreductase [Balneolaceae bacterium]
MVVGAGIVGLSSAIFYKRSHPSARVLVLDKGMMPEGASTRNAGFACVGSITEHLADIEKESAEAVKRRIRARYDGLTLLRALLGDEQIDYEACGGYELFKEPQRFEEASQHIDKFNRWLDELIDEKKVYSATELNGYPVIYNRLEGSLHPGKMMQQLVEMAGREGVTIFWNSKVGAVDRSGSVELTDGKFIEAEQVLLACNGFTKQLFPDIDIKPARGYVMVTNPQESMPWKGTFHHDRGYVYFRNIGDRLLIGGGRNLAYEEEQTSGFGTNQKIKEYLKNFVSDTLKLNPGWQIEHEWSGIMGFTETKTPIVKKVDEKRVIAAGLSGMGVAIGAAIGKKTASLLSKKSEDL